MELEKYKGSVDRRDKSGEGLKIKAQPKRALKTTSGAVGTTSNGEI